MMAQRLQLQLQLLWLKLKLTPPTLCMQRRRQDGISGARCAARRACTCTGSHVPWGPRSRVHCCSPWGHSGARRLRLAAGSL